MSYIKNLFTIYFKMNKKFSIKTFIEYLISIIKLKYSELIVLSDNVYIFNYGTKKLKNIYSILLKNNKPISKKYKTIFPVTNKLLIANNNILLRSDGMEIKDFKTEDVEILIMCNYLDNYIIGENWTKRKKFIFDKYTYKKILEIEVPELWFHTYVLDFNQPICMYVKDVYQKGTEYVYQNILNPDEQVYGEETELIWEKNKK